MSLQEACLKEREVCLDWMSAGSNRTNAKRDATRHAEMEALDVLSDCMQEMDLSDCTLIVTCEPCIMCAAALSLVKIGLHLTLFRLVMCKIGKVYYGCSNERFGGCGSVLDVRALGVRGACSLTQGFV